MEHQCECGQHFVNEDKFRSHQPTCVDHRLFVHYSKDKRMHAPSAQVIQNPSPSVPRRRVVGGPLAAPLRVPAHLRSSSKWKKPRKPTLFVMCYLCQKEYAPAVLYNHLSQCYDLQLDIWHRTSPSARGSPPTSPHSFFNQPHPPAHSPPPVPHTFRRFRPGFTSVHLDSHKPSPDGGVASKPLTANQLVLLTNKRCDDVHQEKGRLSRPGTEQIKATKLPLLADPRPPRPGHVHQPKQP
mmetsp:Transcript_77893/g.137324  ORF Transcript_77893/g.137324 Transcript_77893/m.137324 type:complete len:240 (-) Transcript_77893:1272-1991(-)